MLTGCVNSSKWMGIWRTGQDMRFDVPVIGINTIEKLVGQ
jgi:DUF1009 family protein